MTTRMKLRRDTAANWTSVNPVLGSGEEGFETDTRKRKVGDGTTAWTSLTYDTASAPVQSVAGRSGAVVLTKTDVGLPLVDNTADTAKPVSTATQTALDAKAPRGNANPAALGTATALAHGRSACIQLVGDSTGDATDEWFALLGQTLATAYDANCIWRKWDDTAQSYGDSRTTLATGAAGERHAVLAAASLQYTATAITGDLDIVAKIRPTSWASGATQIVAARYETTGNQRGFFFQVNTSGKLSLTWSTDGTSGTAVTVTSTTSVPFSNGTDGWVRATLDVDNGSSGRTVTFYTSTDGVTWTGLDSPFIAAGVTSIHASTAPYQVGSYGTAITTPLSGRVYWVEIRNAIGGQTVVPPLMDDWEQASSSLTDTITWGGAPTILLLCGSQSGQNITYFDNATRRPKLLAQHGQKLLILSTGQNDSSAAATFVAAYSTWVTNVKAAVSGVPILCLTQNPVTTPMSVGSAQIRAARGVALMTWVASQNAGLYGLDTYPAFTNLATQLNVDGQHPNATGSALWAAYVYDRVFRR